MSAKKNSESVKPPKSCLSFVKIILVSLLIIAIIGLLALYQKYLGVKRDLVALRDPVSQQEKLKAETRILVDKVSQLAALPTGEPTIATIVDSEALAREQTFFKDAKNGDKVLIYKDQAIIYNPVTNSIVNIGSVWLVGDNHKEVATTTVEIRNGSQKIGAANELADELKISGFAITTIGNATNLDYQTIILVNLTGRDIRVLEDKLQVKAITQLPEGEATSSQDVVIILGNTKK